MRPRQNVVKTKLLGSTQINVQRKADGGIKSNANKQASKPIFRIPTLFLISPLQNSENIVG